MTRRRDQLGSDQVRGQVRSEQNGCRVAPGARQFEDEAIVVSWQLVERGTAAGPAQVNTYQQLETRQPAADGPALARGSNR